MPDRAQALQQLASLGAARWSTNPPDEGRIRWYDRDGVEVASGRFAVVLSVGPGDVYTMGHAVGGYAAVGIPFLPPLDEEPSVVVGPVDEAALWRRAEAAAAAAGADFAYACTSLIVAVSGFAPTPRDEGSPLARARARVSRAAASWLDLVERGDVGAMDFAREDVGWGDVPALAELGLALPDRAQRVALVLFTRDHLHPALVPLWRALLELAPPAASAEERLAFAVAAAGLRGDLAEAERLAADLPGLLTRVEALRVPR